MWSSRFNNPTGNLDIGEVWDGDELSVHQEFSERLLEDESETYVLASLRGKMFLSSISMNLTSLIMLGDHRLDLIQAACLHDIFAYFSCVEISDTFLDVLALKDMICLIGLKLFSPSFALEVARGKSNRNLLMTSTPFTNFYELIIRIINCSQLDRKQKLVIFTEDFCISFIRLIRSNDSKEREYVKTVIHSMYSCLIDHRVSIQEIKRSFADTLYFIEMHAACNDQCFIRCYSWVWFSNRSF